MTPRLGELWADMYAKEDLWRHGNVPAKAHLDAQTKFMEAVAAIEEDRAALLETLKAFDGLFREDWSTEEAFCRLRAAARAAIAKAEARP